jgi:hypothetical protein
VDAGAKWDGKPDPEVDEGATSRGLLAGESGGENDTGREPIPWASTEPARGNTNEARTRRGRPAL